DGAGVRDPMAIAIEATSRHGTPQAALDMVRFVAEHSTGNSLENHFYDFDNKPLDARAEALSELFLAHGDTLLADLTVADPRQTPGSTNDRSTAIGKYLTARTNLLRITALGSWQCTATSPPPTSAWAT